MIEWYDPPGQIAGMAVCGLIIVMIVTGMVLYIRADNRQAREAEKRHEEGVASAKRALERLDAVSSSGDGGTRT